MQNFRKETGKFNAKLGKKENKETESHALARKQPDPIPFKKILLFLAIFGAVAACLYAYLTYVLADDEEQDFGQPAAHPHAQPTADGATGAAGGGADTRR